MPDSPSLTSRTEPFGSPAPSSAQARGVSRRLVLGTAAWVAPVVAISAAAPLAAASTGNQPVASLSWSETEGVQGQSSLLTLLVPVDSPGVGSTGTVVLTVLDDGPIPSAVTTGRWTYSPDFTASTAVIASPVGGVTAGVRGFTVEEWGDRSGPYTVIATYTNDREPGSLTATITVGFGPEPTLVWTPNPAEFGGTATLRLTIPQYSYAIGQRGVLFDFGTYPFPDAPPPFPPGTTTVLPDGWTTETDPQTGTVGFVNRSVAEGVYDFEYTLGSGTTSITPEMVLSVGAGIPTRSPLTIVPA